MSCLCLLGGCGNAPASVSVLTELGVMPLASDTDASLGHAPRARAHPPVGQTLAPKK